MFVCAGKVERTGRDDFSCHAGTDLRAVNQPHLRALCPNVFCQKGKKRRNREITPTDLFPAIAAFEDVMREYIAPRDKRYKNNAHQDGFDVFRRRVVDLVRGP